MADYIVEIGDGNGVSFKIAITKTTSFSGLSGNGSWRTKDKGFITYNSGEAVARPSKGTMTTHNLLLFNKEGKWGIKLNNFHDWIGANDEGIGELVQNWAVGIAAGRISWALVK